MEIRIAHPSGEQPRVLAQQRPGVRLAVGEFGQGVGDQLPADADDLFADLLFAAGKVVVQRTFRRPPARLEDLVEARCRIPPLAAKQIGRSSYECFAVFRGGVATSWSLNTPSDPPQSM